MNKGLKININSFDGYWFIYLKAFLIGIELIKFEHKINPNIENIDSTIVLDEENSFLLSVRIEGPLFTCGQQSAEVSYEKYRAEHGQTI